MKASEAVSHLLEELESVLASTGSDDASTELVGAWSAQPRRAYATAAQLGSGRGPYVEVVDHRWSGALVGSAPLVGLALQHVTSGTAWARCRRAPGPLDVGLSCLANPNGLSSEVAVTLSLGSAQVGPVVVSASGRPPDAWPIRAGEYRVGRVIELAASSDVALAIVPIPAVCVRTLRNGLWQARPEYLAHVTPELRSLLTRGRHGWIPAG